jgi:predicted NAD-dependent protein-ADP-ribosyltransferase YbiA (DUF1768 family)
MIQSRLDKTIRYNEKRNMYSEDINHSSGLYEISVLDTDIAVAVGKMRTEKKGIVYYPLYIVGDDKKDEPVIKSQIGLFEVDEKECLSVLDEDNNLCLEKLDSPLLFRFVTDKFLKKVDSQPKKYIDIITSSPKESKTIVEKREPDPESKDDEESPFSLKVNETRETKIIKEKLKDGVFDIKPHFETPPYLEEEIASTADDIRSNYKMSETDVWIQKYMTNPHYDIIEVESNGDCLFATIRDAYKENGHITTVSKLRAIVADSLTMDIYGHQRELYEMYNGEKKNLEKEIKQLKMDIDDPTNKEKIKSEKNKETKKKMIDTVNAKVKIYNEKVIEYGYSKSNIKEFAFMKDIHTIEDYRKYIMTSNYWADAWSIFVLEQVLKMKMIIFGEESFEKGDKDNVIHCGYSLHENIKTFNPTFYIMTTYSGNHYRLISYKTKRLLTFQEIPYDVKILIVKKCMEKNGGIYHLIPEFRDFKSKLHVEEDAPMRGGESSDYYDADVVFTFHAHSVDKAPGKGVNETLSDSNFKDFALLVNIENWRKKLDDSWQQEHLLNLDNKKWKSVEHYVLGSQYKKGFPDVYLKFSLDSDSDISKDLSLAKKALLKSGVKVNGEIMKAEKDSDSEQNSEEHRKMAVRAKFTQNADFRNLLLSTKFAILQHFVAGAPPVLDEFLMKLRKELLTK